MPTGVYVLRMRSREPLKGGSRGRRGRLCSMASRAAIYREKIIERIRLLACWTNWALSEGYTFATTRSAYAHRLR